MVVDKKRPPGAHRSVAFLVFAKLPLPGQVKTRIARSLGAEAAADLAGAFLADTLAQLRDWKLGDVHLLGNQADPTGFAPYLRQAQAHGAHADSAAESNSRIAYWDQGQGDLGARQARALERARNAGYSGVVLFGADTPHLPRQAVEDALSALQRGEPALGPAQDGGYYLLALPTVMNLAGLFDDVAWGEPSVGPTLKRRLADRGRWRQLQPHQDFDEWEDVLWWFRSTEGQTNAPLTRDWIRRADGIDAVGEGAKNA